MTSDAISKSFVLLSIIVLFSLELWNISKSALPAAFPNCNFLLSGKNIPSLNVPIPTESTLITSSYVRVPAIDTLPENVASVAVIDPSLGPTNLVAVITPTS